MFLVIQETITQTKFIKSNSSAYKSGSLAVLAMLNQFIMKCNFLLHTKVEENFLLEDINILLLGREKIVKNSGNVLIHCVHLRS